MTSACAHFITNFTHELGRENHQLKMKVERHTGGVVKAEAAISIRGKVMRRLLNMVMRDVLEVVVV